MWRLILALCTLGCVGQDDPNSDTTAPKIAPNDTIPEYLAKYSIPVEEHWITTEDGYILESFRLVRQGAPVLLLQHGILASAWCWVFNDPSVAPGIQLYKQGYDVWLTNSRGNTFSRNHTTLKPDLNKQFWNFTFMEMGKYDVPANIKYILGVTAKSDLTYMGWSQGTSQFLVAMVDPSVKEYVEKAVNLFVGIAPVSWMKHQKSALFTAITDLHLDGVLDDAFPYGFLEAGGGIDTFAHVMCKLTAGLICKFTVDILAGRSGLDSNAAITNLTAHFPAGCSSKSLRHYAQLIRTGQFNYYDYGPDGNFKEYGQNTTPPILNGKTIGVPTALFGGSRDDLADVKDVNTLTEYIGSTKKLVYSRVFDDFSHMTFFDGTSRSFTTWYPDLRGLLRKYNPVTPPSPTPPSPPPPKPPSPPPPSPPSPPAPPSPPTSWTREEGLNCYSGHGATDLDTDPIGSLSLADCEAKCEEMADCTGIAIETYYVTRGQVGDCWRRKDIVPSQCDTSFGLKYDTWLRPSHLLSEVLVV